MKDPTEMPTKPGGGEEEEQGPEPLPEAEPGPVKRMPEPTLPFPPAPDDAA